MTNFHLDWFLSVFHPIENKFKITTLQNNGSVIHTTESDQKVKYHNLAQQVGVMNKFP